MDKDLLIQESHWFWGGRMVTLVAMYDASVGVDSTAGCRVFALKQGETLLVPMRGRKWRAGDRLTLDELLDNVWEWLDVPWSWREDENA